MKSHACPTDEDECELSGSAYCWWRLAKNLLNSNLTPSRCQPLTPRLRVLRELERLALVAPDGLHQIKHKRSTYSSGEFWVPTGGIKKEDMNIPPVNTILLVGFSGSGKSSLVNVMYSVLGRAGLVPFAQTSTDYKGSSSNFTTMYLQEHDVLHSAQSGFCVYDSRGFSYDKMAENLRQLSGWMTEGIQHNQLWMRSGDASSVEEDIGFSEQRSLWKFVRRRVNCVMVVVNRGLQSVQER